MRILYISHYFQPEPIFWALPLAREFVRRGHKVEVLTGFPNYPGGKIYDGYRVRVLQRETMDGVDITRVPLYPSHDQSSLKRIMCYASFGISASIIGPWVTKKADVAYVMQGPMTLGMPASVLKLIKRMPYVIHIQDLWPDTLASTAMFNTKAGLKLLDWYCNSVYKHAERIITITGGMKHLLIERGVTPDKIDVIYNWSDSAIADSGHRDEQLASSLGMAGRFNIVFAGNMGKAQALEPVIDAAKIVASQQPAIQFVFIGSGVCVDSLKQRTAERKLNNVLFLPRRPISEIGAILSLANVLFVHLKKDPLFAITIPSKTQAYLAAGRPILIGVPGDAADLVLRAKAGLACEPENPQSIAEAALSFYSKSKTELDAMGQNGRKFYKEQLAFEIATSRIEEVLAQTARNDGKR